jgi:hypothetical protein
VINVEVKRIEEVSREAVVVLANDLLEWMISQGWKIEHGQSEKSLLELAQEFVEERTNRQHRL